jgi:hypothetical protein
MFFSMSLSRTFSHRRPARMHQAAGGYTILETLIAFVVLVVFVVLAYSFVFRNPSSTGALKSQTAEQPGIPEFRPGATHPQAQPPASVERRDTPSSQAGSAPAAPSTAGR